MWGCLQWNGIHGAILSDMLFASGVPFVGVSWLIDCKHKLTLLLGESLCLSRIRVLGRRGDKRGCRWPKKDGERWRISRNILYAEGRTGVRLQKVENHDRY